MLQDVVCEKVKTREPIEMWIESEWNGITKETKGMAEPKLTFFEQWPFSHCCALNGVNGWWGHMAVRAPV